MTVLPPMGHSHLGWGGDATKRLDGESLIPISHGLMWLASVLPQRAQEVA